ncbi:hypothetical protein NE398_17720 [Clostridium tertium]|uniref:Uncharacterized protein n=1 Tax=Clostridium tertium TaxID=1559 RepID=A0A9X3XPC9_9CLOT|nr:hypothetical protein [Clostridium tertium]MDC4241976.1 hypothetical protein [Clostridium tertium]
MENKKMIEIIKKQIERLEELQEQYFGNLNTVLAISDSIRAHVDLIRSISSGLKEW